MVDVGILTSEEAVSWGMTGPILRATGIAYDVRKAFPYSGYDRYEYDVPTRTEGDAYARFLVRLDEMDEAMRIIRQVRKELDEPGPVQIPDTKFAPPPKETIALSMEALIHHFKLVSASARVRRRCTTCRC
jgi:NADH-quinone oxidoreductase subunit D